MSVEITMSSGDMTAFLEGEIDHHSAKSMRETIDANIEKFRPKLLILDFGKISFMDSSGVGLIMGRYKLMNELGGGIRISNAGRTAARMLKLAGLERLGISI